MKDPLTRAEHFNLLLNFKKQYKEIYQKALASGAVSEENLPEHNHTLARCILMITAEKFEPLTSTGQKMLRNLQHFV